MTSNFISFIHEDRIVEVKNPNFLNEVTIKFGVSNPKEKYHVPLLFSPWSYSTYRGS